MTRIQFSSSSEFSEEEIAATLQSRGFLQMLLYQKLDDGLKLIKDQDSLRDAVAADLTDQHSRIESEEITQEFLDIFADEVLTWSEPMIDGADDTIQITISNPAEQWSESSTDAEASVQDYLESRLSETSPVKLKANEIADEIGLKSTHVGAILGRWRKSNDAPVSVSVSEMVNGSNIWKIEHSQPDSSNRSETSA
ncbi:hypothetical protein [Halorientalis regularis]|uniref:hypothetical protein n=1 Tax=Halorientalis regularis TaxID=660518 RepID=UPI0020330404|nr:hypothetical protein [Halorientalis regularis]